MSVDDVGDITLYYPGDDVVDWTGLDGYNWGSNFSWSFWKSFSETFSAPYNVLVQNYPGKPVIIAEVGSAEPADKPSRRYGQDGDNSDANQSKEDWVYDMYSEIMTEYSWIKAVSWFNINKELSWALTGRGNTGLNAYNEVVQDDHFLGFFETATLSAETEITAFSITGEPDEAEAHEVKAKNPINKPNAAGLSKRFAGVDHHLPKVIGTELLELEKEGLRNLPRQVIEGWRKRRLDEI